MFYICYSLPEFVFSPANYQFNYAYAKHSTNDTCKYMNEFNTYSPFYYYVLIETEKLSTEQRKSMASKLCNVPCLFTCFKELISNLNDYVGPIMKKLTSAVLYNKYHNLETPGQHSRTRLPQVCVQSDYKRTQQTQTNLLPFATINRITKVLYCSPHGVVLCRILDIMQSGYGEFEFKIADYRFKFSMDSSFNLN